MENEISHKEYLALKKKYNGKRIPYPCHICGMGSSSGKILISFGYVFFDHYGRKQCKICRIEDLEKIFMIDAKHPSRVKVRETRSQSLSSSDPIKAFINDCIEYDPDASIPTQELYEEFIKFCKKVKLPKTLKCTFSRKLTREIPQVRRRYGTIDGKRALIYLGIKYVKGSRGEDPR